MASNIVTDGGAVGDGITDDTIAIQDALNAGGNWYFPAGTYLVSSTLLLKVPATGLFGDNMATSIIKYTGTGTCIQNNNFATTLLWTRIEDMQFDAPNINIGYVLEMYSMQFSRIKNVWLLGSSNPNCTAINLAATWIETQCTYNIIDGCYIGGVYNGIVFGDGANNNTISNTRIQPNVNGGNAIFGYPSAAGRSSCNTVISCGFEYPGNISNGINLYQYMDTVFMLGNRFESLNTGMNIGTTCTNIFD